MIRAYLGLGGNLGDPVRAMAQALTGLAGTQGVTVASVSRPYRTAPWGKTDQPAFVNAAAALETSLSAPDLLAACLAAERALKRERRERWGPRTIDIDILLFGQEVLRTEALTVPHPRLAERAFALVPLAELAPDAEIDGAPIAERIAALSLEGIEPLAAPVDWWRRP